MAIFGPVFISAFAAVGVDSLLAALALGGEIAAAICVFIYKQFMPVLIYASSVLVLVGLLAMYLCGEVALSAKAEKKNISRSLA